MGASLGNGQTAELYGIGCLGRGWPAGHRLFPSNVASQQAVKHSERTGKGRFDWKSLVNFADFVLRYF